MSSRLSSSFRPTSLAAIVLSVLLTVTLVAGPASAQQRTFRDVEGSVHAPAVSALATEGIILGCTDASFCPAGGLTRGQVASILARALDLEPPVSASTGQTAVVFRDTSGSVHQPAIASLADAGLTAGCTDRDFCPNEPISRAQLASLLQRAIDLPAAPSGRYFDDTAGTHEQAINALAHGGVAAGCSLVTFCPTQPLTRAQGATFVARALDLVPRARLAPYAERKAQHDAERAKAAAAAAAKQAPGAKAVEVALAQVGKPYRWGGNGPASFDCSGLTGFAWRAAGVTLPRTSRDQYSGTRRVSRGDLQPGDLIFYRSPISHVAMYIGNGRVVEAPSANKTVRVSSSGLSRSDIVGYGRPR